MKAKLFIFSFLFSAFLNAQVMWQFKKDTVIKWYYYDGDEFSGTTYDSEKWIPAFSWTEMNYDMKFRMTPERLVLNDGVCHFMCFRDTGLFNVPNWHLDSAFKKKYGKELVDGNKFPYYYTAGDVWSKGQYERGYFELRFKTTDAYGMYPGFWLFGDNGDEIDFFELKGERSKEIHVDIHCKGTCDRNYKGSGILPHSFGEWIKVTQPLNTAYNVLACQWDNGFVSWYINGEGIAYYKGTFDSKKMALILGTGIAQDGKPFAPGITQKTPFPNSLDVDYVRIWYNKEGPKNSVVGKKHVDFDYYKNDGAAKAKLKRKIKYLYNKKEFSQNAVTISVLPKKGKNIIVSALGQHPRYQITFSDEFGKIITQKRVSESFTEYNFSNLGINRIKVEISTTGKIVSEQISLME